MQSQLMRQTTAVGISWQHGPEEGCEVGVVVRRMCCPVQQGRKLAVAQAVLYNGLC